MEITMETGVPIPTKYTKGLTAQIMKLAIGDSFTVPLPDDRKKARNLQRNVCSLAARKDIKVTTRRLDEEGVLRVWRI